MALYSKLPVEVEAYQVTKEFLAPILFDGGEYPEGLMGWSSTTHTENRTIHEWIGTVTTIHGQKTHVDINDWILAEPDGIHFYPCKPDIFNKTYELVSE